MFAIDVFDKYVENGSGFNAWISTGGGNVNQRSSYSSSSALVQSIPDDSIVWVMDVEVGGEIADANDGDSTWFYISYGGHKGWVYSKFLTMEEPPAESSGSSGGSNKKVVAPVSDTETDFPYKTVAIGLGAVALIGVGLWAMFSDED